jgi:hypothetical protein
MFEVTLLSSFDEYPIISEIMELPPRYRGLFLEANEARGYRVEGIIRGSKTTVETFGTNLHGQPIFVFAVDGEVIRYF